jgi:hypothetical protein
MTYDADEPISIQDENILKIQNNRNNFFLIPQIGVFFINVNVSAVMNFTATTATAAACTTVAAACTAAATTTTASATTTAAATTAAASAASAAAALAATII